MHDFRARHLSEARANLRKLAEYPGNEPESLAEAISIQEQATVEMGVQVIGWKIGCTSEVARKALGAIEPFFGPLLRERSFQSGDYIPTSQQSLRIVETEVAARLKTTLKPRTDTYSLDEVLGAVGTLIPALEVVDRRAPGTLSDGLWWNIADGGVNDAIVLGDECPNISDFDFVGCETVAQVNCARSYNGRGDNALGGAHKALQWLVNEFSRQGRTLKKGDIVTTGLTTDIFSVLPGDKVTSEIQGLGRVSAAF